VAIEAIEAGYVIFVGHLSTIAESRIYVSSMSHSFMPEDPAEGGELAENHVIVAGARHKQW
jgi:hypothetical protein